MKEQCLHQIKEYKKQGRRNDGDNALKRFGSGNARHAIGRLHQQLVRYTSGHIGTANVQRTGIIAELFAGCAGKYRDRAEMAARLDNDRRKIRSSWPRAIEKNRQADPEI